MQTCALATTQSVAQNNGCLATELPAEILGEIFQAYIHTLSEDSLWNESNVLSTPTGDSPLLLGQICAYWRNVALGMQTLWSSIFVENPTSDHIELVRLWLDRAGSCPLTLILRDWCDSGNRECSEGTEAIVKLFVDNAENWWKIDIVMEFGDSSVLDTLQECHKLESALVSARHMDGDALNVFWAKLHRSPVLRQVNWQHSFSGGLPHHAPWDQLQSITTLSPLSDTEFIFLLHACPQVHSMDVPCYVSSLFPPTSAPLTHNHLQNLILRLTGDRTTFLDAISLPRLRSLCLDIDCSGFLPNAAMTIGKPIEDLLARSRCRLDQLDIQQVLRAPPCCYAAPRIIP